MPSFALPSAASSPVSLAPSTPSEVLAVTGEADLADELHRLAAAAGVPLVVQPALPSTAQWSACGLLLVGSDVARRAVSSGRPRRPGVLVVTADADDPRVWQHAVGLGAEQVAVLPLAREWLVERMAEAGEPVARAVVLGVIGGCGGAGASVLAAAIALAGSRTGRPVLLADLDPLSAGADLIVGADEVPGLRWAELADARGRLQGASVRSALPKIDSLSVLTWRRGEPIDLPIAAVDAVLSAASRAHDLVVLDLPRALDEAGAAALARADELLVVLPATVRATAATAQLLARLGPATPHIGVVVRQGQHDRLTPTIVADALAVPLALQMREEPKLDVLLEQGEPPAIRTRSPLRRAAEQWLALNMAGRLAA